MNPGYIFGGKKGRTEAEEDADKLWEEKEAHSYRVTY